MSDTTIASLFKRHIRTALKRPRKLLRLFSPNARKLLRLKMQGVGDEFLTDAATAAGGTLKRRAYRSYEVYLAHQSSKLDMLISGDSFGCDGVNLSAYELEFRQVLRARLASLDLNLSGRNVLCLAARLGTEVRAFLDCGAFAVGVDLNPGANNRHVLPGDFHHLIFADESVDCIYSNSVDHAFDLQGLATEIVRVLKPSGQLVLEVHAGKAEREQQSVGLWESYDWSYAREIAEVFARSGLREIKSVSFESPWRGTSFVLVKSR